MKKMIEVPTTEVEAGLTALLGKEVLLMCSSYYYYGKLAGVNENCVLLTNPKIVYQTGKWDAKKWVDAQSLYVEEWYVQIAAIESFGEVANKG